jgi:cyclophilin family peptidyl-prolyl cis-trans isomerase/HEAT repeat protein
MKWRLFCLGLSVALSSCDTAVNKFTQPDFQRVADLQDRRVTDSLLLLFTQSPPEVRRDAAMAFASLQDTSAAAELGTWLMTEQDERVREAIAFALGQTPCNISAQVLRQLLDKEPGNAVAQEALGKTGTAEDAERLNAWGLYRLGLRGLADTVALLRATSFLSSPLENDRLGAAHFFARGPAAISMAVPALIHVAQQDSSVYVRMAAASALRKHKSVESGTVLRHLVVHETDYRVRISAIRALSVFDEDEVKKILLNATQDAHVQVAIAAAEAVRQIIQAPDVSQVVSLARTSTNWRVRTTLFEAAMATTSHKELAEDIIRLAEASGNPYEVAGYITALGHSPMSYAFVAGQLKSSPVPVVKTSAAAALVAINRHTKFEQSLAKPFEDIILFALESGDGPVIGTVSELLADSALGYKQRIPVKALYNAKARLSLPRDNEALQPLERAIAYFEGRDPKEVTNTFNHPVDWALVKTIPVDQRVSIQTRKGEVIIRLHVEEAPGSVANFIQLAQAGYFNGKNFHRVVPNFVIQGGCNRGDGWGSEDYSIRSEFSLMKYAEGSVGMASAGKDTEGTQWFITHSPTPHLDGRYTLFASVLSGMEVVHAMEVGDQIERVELIPN